MTLSEGYQGDVEGIGERRQFGDHQKQKRQEPKPTGLINAGLVAGRARGQTNLKYVFVLARQGSADYFLRLSRYNTPPSNDRA